VKAFAKVSESPQQPKFKSTYYMDVEQENLRRMEVLSPVDEFVINFPPDYDLETFEVKAPDYQKTFIRRKVPQSAYWKIEELGAELLASKDPKERARIVNDRYRLMSKLYLEEKDTHKTMTDEDYKRADWEQLKYVLMACNHAFVHGRLPLARKSGIA
jgi:hypothetical protein